LLSRLVALHQRREPVERAPTDGYVPGRDKWHLDNDAAAGGLARVAVDAVTGRVDPGDPPSESNHAVDLLPA
jgi:hypothetical protein